MEKREGFSPVLFIIIVLILSALAGYWAGSSSAGQIKLEGKLGIWWKLTVFCFGIIFVAVETYLVPLEKLPINKLKHPPKSIFHFLCYLKYLKIEKKFLLSLALLIPFLVISYSLLKIHYSYLLAISFGLFLSLMALSIWITTLQISPTLENSKWTKALVYILILILLSIIYALIEIYIFPAKIKEIKKNYFWNMGIDMAFIGFSAFLISLIDSYRCVKKDWKQLRNKKENDPL